MRVMKERSGGEKMDNAVSYQIPIVHMLGTQRAPFSMESDMQSAVRKPQGFPGKQSLKTMTLGKDTENVEKCGDVGRESWRCGTTMVQNFVTGGREDEGGTSFTGQEVGAQSFQQQL